jgi:RES domain-containing protein
VNRPRRAPHRHNVVRVVRAGWTDPLDAGFSRDAKDKRWNTPDFPALYCCCSEAVARAAARDVFRAVGIARLNELQSAYRPPLIEIAWSGDVVDVASEEGVVAAGLPSSYPAGVDRRATRQRAVEWHAGGAHGVVCRSASLHRVGLSMWAGDHRPWGELAIWTCNAPREPKLLCRRQDHDWLSSSHPAGDPGAAGNSPCLKCRAEEPGDSAAKR